MKYASVICIMLILVFAGGCVSAPPVQAVEKRTHHEEILVEKSCVNVNGFMLSKIEDKETGNLIYLYQGRLTLIKK